MMKKSRVSKSNIRITKTSPSSHSGGTEDKLKDEEPTIKDVHSIEIVLDVIENVKGMHQASTVHIKSEYNGQVLDICEKTLIIDEKVELNWSFYIDIDTLSQEELDDLVSKPIIFTAYETAGQFDPEMFKSMQMFEDIGQDTTITSFDSAVSIYEAFTGVTVEDKAILRQRSKKKGRKKKAGKSAKTSVTKEGTTSKHEQKTKSKRSETATLKQKKSADATSVPTTTDDLSVVIGMATMDMLPVLLGNQTFDVCLDLKPLTVFDDDRMSTYKNIPKMCVTVIIDTPIKFKLEPAILNFTVESIYNIPQVMCSPDTECRICVWLPFNDSGECKLIFGHSIFKAEDVEYQMKAWLNTPIIGDNVNTTKYRIRRDFDNVRHNMKKKLSSVIKRDNPQLVYNYIKRNILMDHNKTMLYNYLLRYRTILLEIYMTDRDTLPSLDVYGGKRRRSVISNLKVGPGDSKRKGRPTTFLHMMALVDISSLVYPGVTSTRVACQLSTYHEKEVKLATGIQDSFFCPKAKPIEIVRNPVNEKVLRKVESEKIIGSKKRDASNASGSSKKKGKKKSASVKNESLRRALPPPPAPEEEEEPSAKIFNENGDPTVIILELEISEPLVKARPAEDLMTNLKELVPTKPVLPKTALSTKIVEDNYRNVIQQISMDLKEHLMEYKREQKLCECTTQADFMTYLRRLGVYRKYILTLRKAISILINKKYDTMEYSLRRTNKKDQDLIGKFFVYLVSQMNTILNKQNCSISCLFTEGSTFSMDATLFYAKESSEAKRYTAAEKYYMERIFLDEDNPSVWFDYAVFQLELDSPELAFEYLNEALSKKLDHTNSLLLYGILLTEKGKMADAETCFMTVLIHRPRWVEGWGVLYLFYQKNHNAGGMTFAEDRAKRYLNDERTEQDYFMKCDDLIWRSDILPRTVFFKTAVILLKLRMYYWVENALSFEIAAHPGIVNYILAVICYFQENYDHALDHLSEAKLLEGWNYALVALTGHCLLWKHQYEKARKQYFYVLESYDRPDDMHMVYVHCSRVLSILGQEQEARQIILKACKNNPTPDTWMVAGIFFYNEKDFLSAEECFTEANICNNRIPEVWAFLTLINLKLDRETEAELCYQQAIKNEIDDEKLLAAISEETSHFQKRKSES